MWSEIYVRRCYTPSAVSRFPFVQERDSSALESRTKLSPRTLRVLCYLRRDPNRLWYQVSVVLSLPPTLKSCSQDARRKINKRAWCTSCEACAVRFRRFASNCPRIGPLPLKLVLFHNCRNWCWSSGDLECASEHSSLIEPLVQWRVCRPGKLPENSAADQLKRRKKFAVVLQARSNTGPAVRCSSRWVEIWRHR